MDDVRFDVLTRVLGFPTNRRATMRALAAGVGLLGLAVPHNVDAKKKKKKCKKPKVKCGKKCCAAGQKCLVGKCAVPCAFTKTPAQWTLLANCTTTDPIQVPEGVELDGNGKTISLAGSVSGYASFGVSGGDADLTDLTVDGGALTDACAAPNPFSLIGWSGGTVDNVQSLNNRCIFGIRVSSTTGTNTDMVDCTVTGTAGSLDTIGIVFEGNGAGSVRNSTLRGAFIPAVFMSTGATVTVEDTTIEDAQVGVIVSDTGTQATIADNTISNVSIGATAFSNGSMTVTGNTISGAGPGSEATAGVQFAQGGAGSVSGNTISNFKDGNPAATSCGIAVEADAGTVTIGANTFPTPPGNEQDVCDNRPYPASLGRWRRGPRARTGSADHSPMTLAVDSASTASQAA